MAKRLKIEQFKELIRKEKLVCNVSSREQWKDFAANHDIMIPTAFWKECKISYGKYGLREDTSIQSSNQVNEDIKTALPDDEFELVVEDDDILIVKSIKVTDLVSGQSMSTTIRADASEESIKGVFNFYKKRLRHM